MAILISNCPACGGGRVLDDQEVPDPPEPSRTWHLTAPCPNCVKPGSYQFELSVDGEDGAILFDAFQKP